MDPVLISAILALAGIIITTFGPSAIRIAGALVANKDPVAALADEDVGEILHEESHLDVAMAAAHANQAAMVLRTVDIAALPADARLVVVHALSIHDLVLLAETKG